MLDKVVAGKIYGLDVDESPDCADCGGRNLKPIMMTPKMFNVVECNACKLRFNSPRINERQWLKWNFDINNRVNRNFVVNRLLYGVMFDKNIKASHNMWRKRRWVLESGIMDGLEKFCSRKRLEWVHDVGTGVGFSLAEARRRGITATGNEINGFACKVMLELFEFVVYMGTLDQVPLENGSLDGVIMRDYIEHSYHPRQDLQKAFSLLKIGGVLFLETFNIDCKEFEKQGMDWPFLSSWDHVYYFSRWTISRMMKSVGFRIVHRDGGRDKPLVKIYARKEP